MSKVVESAIVEATEAESLSSNQSSVREVKSEANLFELCHSVSFGSDSLTDSDETQSRGSNEQDAQNGCSSTACSSSAAAAATAPHRKNRAEAREQVALAWQERRKQPPRKQHNPKDSTSTAVPGSSNTSVASSSNALLPRRSSTSALDKFQLAKPLGLPAKPAFKPQGPGCFFPALEGLLLCKPPAPKKQPAPFHKNLPGKPAGPQDAMSASALAHGAVRNKKAIDRNKDYFPSLLAIRQAHELNKQIASLFNDEDDDEDHHSDPANPESEKLLLSVLPAGYNWNQAVFEMAKSRSRAFWLLDVATIVKLLVEWKRNYAGSNASLRSTGSVAALEKMHHVPSHAVCNASATTVTSAQPQVKFLFRVSANAHSILLNVLSRFPDVLRLVTANAWDLEQCRRHVLPKKTNVVILDDSTVTGKPDAYLRKGCTNEQMLSCIAVDGPDEVHRMWDSLERFQKRRNPQDSTSSDTKVMNVCFRLPVPTTGQEDTVKGWMALWRETQAALKQRSPKSRIEALSLDVSILQQQVVEGRENIFTVFCKGLLEEQGYQQALKLRLEVTGPSLNLDRAAMAYLPLLLHNTAVQLVIHQVCLDLTHPLLSSAGGLCTRVIGVRQQLTPQGEHRQHYYIDDGCYGSLYQGNGGDPFTPVPLMTTTHGTMEEGGPSAATFVSTVWGPTCDGLDRVCRDIPLPQLHRDDWLVFPNLGAGNEGLGTAFNGFSPPDTAYCVLGYFRN